MKLHVGLIYLEKKTQSIEMEAVWKFKFHIIYLKKNGELHLC